MFALLKLIQSIIKTLHSDGTPGQVAAGMALGAALGLTPLMNVHNLVVFSLILLLNVSFGGGMLGWALFVPLGFLLDPLFHAIGLQLLEAPSLRSLWTGWYNTPLIPYTNFNNTVVLGSVVGWLVLARPDLLRARAGAWPATARRSAPGCSSRSSTRRSRRRRCTTSTASSGRSEHDGREDLPLEGDRAAARCSWSLVGGAALALRRAGGEGHDRGGEHRAARAPRWTSASSTSSPTRPRWTCARCRSPIPSTPTGTWSRRPRSGSSSIPLALAEKKFVVENFRLSGMRFGTDAEDAGATGGGRRLRAAGAARGAPVVAAVRRADPQAHPDRHHQAAGAESRPSSPRCRPAQAVAARADSARRALDQSFQQLDIKGTVDTARGAGGAAPRHQSPRSSASTALGEAIEDAQRDAQAPGGRQEAAGGAGAAGEGRRRDASPPGSQTLDEARKKDYAFARSLLQLPTFSAPEIGEAFFGKVSIDRFQQALYYTELARHYMPPGLLPREDPGPQRLRASGKTIRFPKEREWPKFLLQAGQMDLAIGGDSPLRGRVRGGGAGTHLGPVALREADAGAHQPHRRGERHRRDRRAAR